MSSRDFREVSACRVCGAADWLEVLSFGPMPLANRYVTPGEPPEAEPRFPLDVVFCPRCGLLCLKQVVDPRVLYLHYVYISSESLMIQAHTQWLAQRIMSQVGLDGDRLVVEFGSNIGLQLGNFRALGCQVLGVDPAANLAEIAERRGIPTIADFFNAESAKTIVQRAGHAHVILGRHVFAHVDELDTVFEAAATCLAGEGVMVIEVPYLVDMVDGNEFDTIYHEHLSYFSVETLRKLFRRSGFRIFDVERVDVHGGSIVVFACHAGAKWRPTARLETILAEEARRGVHTARYFVDFAGRARAIRDGLRARVSALKRDGARIAGYGAPAKGNTLLNFCGFGPAELDFVTDTTAFKQGMLLPGTRVPIRAEEYGRQHAPDYFLMLAWNYAREIVRKERPFLERGGRFIVPIPTPVVVAAQDVEAFLTS